MVEGEFLVSRGGQPEEVVAAIAWLLSDEVSCVTGSIREPVGGKGFDCLSDCGRRAETIS